jgi:hypothetical protein
MEILSPDTVFWPQLCPSAEIKELYVESKHYWKCMARVFYGYPDEKILIFNGSKPLDQSYILILADFALFLHSYKRE